MGMQEEPPFNEYEPANPWSPLNTDTFNYSLARMREIVEKIEKEMRERYVSDDWEADLIQGKDGHYILFEIYAKLAYVAALEARMQIRD